MSSSPAAVVVILGDVGASRARLYTTNTVATAPVRNHASTTTAAPAADVSIPPRGRDRDGGSDDDVAEWTRVLSGATDDDDDDDTGLRRLRGVTKGRP